MRLKTSPALNRACLLVKILAAKEQRRTFSENHGILALLLLLGNLFEERVNDGDCKHDTRSTANGAHEVCENAERTNADSSKGGRNVDVTGQVTRKGRLLHVSNRHLLLHQVCDDVSRRRSRHVNPNAGEESTGAHYKGNVKQTVKGVFHNFSQRLGRHHIVGQTANRSRISLHVKVLPHAKELHEEVSTEFTVENLGEEVEIGHEGCLENDGDVGSVEELDWVRGGIPANSLRNKLQFNSHTLEVDDDKNDNDR